MQDKTKILHIITQSEPGGAQRYVFDLATSLPPAEFEVYVAAGGQGGLFGKLDEKGVKTFPLKHLVREISPINDLLAIIEICRLIRRLKPDIVHLNSSKAGVVGSIASFFARFTCKHKLIYTVHGFVFNEPMSPVKRLFYIWLEKISALVKDKLICVSEFDRQQGLKYKICPEAKLATINNGVPLLSFLSAVEARTQLNLPVDKFIIGTIANFYATKGLSYLIQAAAKIVPAKPEVIFIIIGEGELRKELEKEIEKFNLKNNFLLAGAKPEAHKYLSAFNLFVLPSLKEGFSYTILEAMQAGLPIIATAVGGNPEIIGDQKNGLLVRPADAKELSDAMIRLLSNYDLAEKLGKQAKMDAENNFTLEKMIGETEEIYID